MGQKPFPPPPPRPDPRLTPQSVHGNWPFITREEARLRFLQDQATDELQAIQDYEAKKMEMLQAASRRELMLIEPPEEMPWNTSSESRSRPMDTSTHDPDRIVRVFDARRVDYGFHFSWRHYAAFWIAIDIALTGVALYITFSPKF